MDDDYGKVRTYCGQCQAWDLVDKENNVGFCQLTPPTPFPAQAQNPITGQVSMQVISIRAQTSSETSCFNGVPKISVVIAD